MRLAPASLLLTLLVSSLPPAHGLLEISYTDMKCECVQETSIFIPIRLIDRLQIVPPGNGCPRKEVRLWLKTKVVVCVTPQAKWLQRLIQLLQKKNTFSTPPAPVTKNITK
ncbi:C-X-C motif chemokine 13 [Ochotona curzoniae]|uniref:C-X-C motif chemokine 13 n=1 Tax=Ochotona curzoniae TaxID=130825 RepID=UPI001B34C3EF|nr:C-X-C motif chemokine 13 [Ochotona curzoniae]